MADDLIASAKSMTSISENQHVTVGMPSNAITPATLTAMVGLSKGGALAIPSNVTSAISSMQAEAIALANTNPTLSASLTSAATALSTQTTKLMAAGPAGFGKILNQVTAHINDAIELKTATNFMANTSFGDYGSGITNMGSLTTQGLDSTLGNLKSVGAAFAAAGPVFDLTDMKNFGNPVGLIKKLTSSRLANASGFNSALVKAGVDTTNIEDPTQATKIAQVVESIDDPAVLNTIADQYGVSPSNLTNASDLLDVNKLAGPSADGMTTDLIGAAKKMSSMGASFKSPADATKMFASIEVPDVPNLNSFAPTMSGLMSDLTPDIDSMIGTGTGPMGVPSATDFFGGISGQNPAISAINNGTFTTESVSAISSMVSQSNSLFATAGIDLDTPPTVNAGTIKAFATGLHKLGADTVSGSGDILKSMATNDGYGDAIKASLAEGKNKMLMAANGISPLSFTDANPFKGLPSDPTNTSSADAAKLLGG